MRRADKKLIACGRRASWSAAVLSVALGMFAAACSEAAPAVVAELPLTGESPAGQEWRLEAAKAEEGDDVPASWCLQLRYEEDIAFEDEPLAGGTETCGPRPAPRVSGAMAINCARRSAYVFGGARSGVRSVTLHARSGPVVKARRAKLPPRSGFDGYTFMLVIDTRRLPARIEASGAGQRVLGRIASASTLCKPVPGAPKGPEWSGDFRSRK